MKKRKEPTHDQTSPATFFKVRQRTKELPITIEGFIKIKEGAFLQGEGFKQKEDKIKLKVTIPSSDWRKLWKFCLRYTDDFAKQFWSNLIYPAMKELETKKGARGRYKESKHFVNWLKDDASFLYAFFTYWCKNPVEDWPDYLQRLISKVKKDGWYDYIFKEKGGTNRPYRLTRYCIEKVYGALLESCGLKPFADPKNFSETYIYGNGRAARVTKFFIEGKTHQKPQGKKPREVANLAFEPSPLKFIFERLQII